MKQKRFILTISLLFFVVCFTLPILFNIVQSDASQPQEIISGSSSSESNTYDDIFEPDIAVDSNGGWHIVYTEDEGDYSSGFKISVKYLNSKSLSPIVIDSLSASDHDFESPSIAIDSHNNVHITYCKGSYFSLYGPSYTIYYINNVSGSWSQPQEIVSVASSIVGSDEPLPQTWYAISGTDIAIDSNDNWFIVYAESVESFTTGYYVPSYCEDEVKLISSKSTSPVIIDTHSIAGFDGISFTSPSIAIDSHNNIHIAYSKEDYFSSSPPGSAINYVNNVSSAWSQPQEITNVPIDGVVDSIEPDIAVDSNGGWHIVYRKAEFNNAVETSSVRYLNSQSPSPVIIDTYSGDPNICSFFSPSIAIDSKNNVHITYNKITENISSGPSYYYDTVSAIMYAQLAGRSSLEILDGVDFTAGSEISNDPGKLATGGTAMVGAVTDGVTRLLLRLPVDNPSSVTFSLQGTANHAEDGVLRSIDGFEEGNSITADTVTVGGKEYAFAIYQAPDSFVRSGHEEDKQATERMLTIQIKVGDSTPTQKDIKLVRPPLILVHGLWSDSSMWAENNCRVKLGTAIPGLRMFAVDYADTNDSSFIINKYKVKNAIVDAKGQFRNNKIAMIQADVLGHSMGGLLARIWAGYGDNVYFRKDNYWMGDIHKLITLDSPHYGAFLADLSTSFVNNLKPSLLKEWALNELRSRGEAIDTGAVRDLMTTSNAINNMDTKEIIPATHAIIGDYIVVSSGQYRSMPADLGLVHSVLTWFGYDTAPYIIQGHSDLVVSTESQSGGLGSNAETPFVHYHTNVTTDNVVSDTIKLLNVSSANTLFNEGFPKKTS